MEHVLWALILTALAAPGFTGLEAMAGQPRMSELGCPALSRYKADCSQGSLSLIAPLALKYGAKPLQFRCHGNSCCVMESGRDCTFRDDALLGDVMRQCSGRLACQVSPAHLRPSQCASPRLFPDRADYTYLEYRCVNVGHLRDVCDTGSVDSGEAHHVVSNVYFNNSKETQRSCSCLVSTRCGAQVVIKAVDIRLAEGENDACLETLNMADDLDPNVNTTITCQDRQLYAWKEIFRSDSNRARISLDIGQKHTGKLWVVVESTDSTSTVELRCGRAQAIPPSEQHACPTTTTTSTSTSTEPPTTTSVPTTPSSTTTSTTTTSPFNNVPGNQDGAVGKAPVASDSSGTAIHTGIIVGAAVGAILVIALLVGLLVVMICILKSKRSERPPPDYDGVVRWQDPNYTDLHQFNPDYDNLDYDNSFGAGLPPVAHSNPGYLEEEKPPIPASPPPSLHPDQASLGSLQEAEVEGAVGGVDEEAGELPEKPPLPVSELEAAILQDPELDNRVNETVDVTPQK